MYFRITWSNHCLSFFGHLLEAETGRVLFQSQKLSVEVDRFIQPNQSEKKTMIRHIQHVHAPRKRLIHVQSCETDLKPTKTLMSDQGLMREVI